MTIIPPNIFYSALLLIAGVACLMVGLIIWQQKNARGADALLVIMGSMAWWDITYAIFWAGVPEPIPYFWLDITYVGVLLTPPALLLFSLRFSGRDHWIRKSTLLALALEPIMVFGILFTDPYHNLFFGGRRAENTGMILEGGPVFYANIAYSYTLIIIACVILVQHYRSTKGLFRKQTGVILAAVTIPWMNSIVFVTGLNPLPGADNTPFAFTLTGLAFAYALTRYRLLELAPIARHALVENMEDGVVVLDANNRVVDLNPAAARELTHLSFSPIGHTLEEVFQPWPDLVKRFSDTQKVQTQIQRRTAPEQHLDLRISPLLDSKGQSIGRLIVWRDISELKKAQFTLEHLASTDTLTGVSNRRHFFELAEALLREARASDQPLSLALVDLDLFKEINDTYGHLAGDKALAGFASICKAALREGDILARFGGEEFAIILPGLDLNQAHMAIESLRQKVASHPIHVDGHTLTLTGSFGLARLESADNLQTLLHRADQALYAAKQNGRNQTVLA